MADESTRTRDRTEFGQRLRAARKHKGLTQSELGDRTGLGQSGIAYLEAKGHASEKTWLIAQTCGVRAAWLATGEGPMVGAETELEAARQVAAEAMPEYLAPNSSTDYRTIVHTLAASIEESGLSVSLRQFIDLADEMYKRFNR